MYRSERTQDASVPRLRLFPASLLLAALSGLCLRADPAVHAVRVGSGSPDLDVWGVYPPEKILKTDAMPADCPTGVLRVSLACEEYEPLLLVVRPRGGRPVLDLRIEGKELPGKAAGTRAEPGVTFAHHRVGYVHVDEPSGMSVLPDVGGKFLHTAIPFGATGRTGFFPDRLIREDKSEAQPGENTQFWVTLQSHKYTDAKTYSGQLRLVYRGGEAVLPLEVRVRGFSIPRRSSLRNTTCWSPQYLKNAWSEEQLRALYADVAAHRQALDPILPFPEVTVGADGAVGIDSSAWERMADYCLDEGTLTMTHLFAPRTGAWLCNVYFLWPAASVTRQKWLGLPIFNEDLTLTDAFRKSYGAYLRHLAKVCEDHEWHDLGTPGSRGRNGNGPYRPLYVSTMDEPHTEEDFRAIREYAAFVKEVAPTLQRFCTAPPDARLWGAIDAWCPQVANTDALSARQTQGEQVMFYKNWLHLIDMPMVNPRLLGWIAWKMQAWGWLTYATMGRWERAWDEPYVIYPNTGIRAWGLGLWWYPDPLGPGILPSIRWETMRDGCEDYEYLKLLADLAQKHEREPLAADAVRAARAFLAEAPQRVILSPGVLPGSTTDDGWENRPAYTQSMSDVHELREQAAALIEAFAAHQRGNAW